MKPTVKRTLAMLLCVLAVFALFPTPAEAATGYSTISSKKVPIQYPTEYLDSVLLAKLKGGKKNNGVYMVPKPETGNGDMGTVKNGSNAIILAEEDEYYFWMTTSGKLGWSSKKYFTEPAEAEDGYLYGSSGLTLEDVENIVDFLEDGDCGFASKNYYANRAVLVMKKGETKRLSVHRKWNGKYTVTWYNDILTVKWPRNSNVSVKAKSKGRVTLYFSNEINDQEFSVKLIVI